MLLLLLVSCSFVEQLHERRLRRILALYKCPLLLYYILSSGTATVVKFASGKKIFLFFFFFFFFFYHYTDVRRHVIVKYFPEFCDKIHKHITLMIFSSDGGARDVLSETESSG